VVHSASLDLLARIAYEKLSNAVHTSRLSERLSTCFAPAISGETGRARSATNSARVPGAVKRRGVGLERSYFSLATPARPNVSMTSCNRVRPASVVGVLT